MLEISRAANFLLTKVYKMVSKYNSIIKTFGFQWLAHIDAEDSTNKRRKLGAEIGDKQMSNYGEKICNYVTTEICGVGESPSMYIHAGAKYSK